jgi:hypothetical protein
MYRKRLAVNFVQIAFLVFEVDFPVVQNSFFLAHSHTYRLTDRQIRRDRQTQRDRWAGSRQTGCKVDRHADRKTYRQKDS